MASKKITKSQLLQKVRQNTNALTFDRTIPFILSDELTEASDRPWKVLLGAGTFDSASVEELESKYDDKLLEVPFREWKLVREETKPRGGSPLAVVYQVDGSEISLSNRLGSMEIRGDVFRNLVRDNPGHTLQDVAHLEGTRSAIILFESYFLGVGSGNSQFSPRQNEMLRLLADQLGGDFGAWLTNSLDKGLQPSSASFDWVLSPQGLKMAWSVYYLMTYCASNQPDIVKEAQHLAPAEKKEVLDAYYKQAYPLLFQDHYNAELVVPDAIKACRDALVEENKSSHDEAAMALLHLTWCMAMDYQDMYMRMAHGSMRSLRIDAKALAAFVHAYDKKLWPAIIDDDRSDVEQAIQAYRKALSATLGSPSASRRAVQSAMQSMDALNDLCGDLFGDGVGESDQVEQALKAFYEATVACTHRQLALRVMAAVFMVVGICAVVAGTGGAGAAPIVGALLVKLSWGAHIGMMVGGASGAGISTLMGCFSQRSSKQHLAEKVHEEAKKFQTGSSGSE